MFVLAKFYSENEVTAKITKIPLYQYKQIQYGQHVTWSHHKFVIDNQQMGTRCEARINAALNVSALRKR